MKKNSETEQKEDDSYQALFSSEFQGVPIRWELKLEQELPTQDDREQIRKGETSV